MSTFVQLHLLTSYPPSNLNRDDLGRPKTAIMGGANRLRISSQSLKRAWRKSDLFEEALDGHVGTRTKEMGIRIYEALLDKDVDKKKAKKWAASIAGVFGKLQKEDSKKENSDLKIEQLAHFSKAEQKAIDDLVEKLTTDGQDPTDEDLQLLREKHKSADIAMFGRMLASAPKYNTEAAVQVAHAITVHKTAVEDDYFTAVDDLNDGDDDLGAAHIGETEFAAGLFYLYICVNASLLKKNLSDDADLTKTAAAALAEAAAKISPTGKQNSFASRAYASYILAETGAQQPRSLSVAFLKPVGGSNYLEDSIKALTETRESMEKVYGPCASAHKTMKANPGEGTLEEIIEFIKEAVDNA